MQSIQGIVTIAQESRFQLMDDDGVGHHFLLSYRAAVEPEQLPALQRDQSRVRVWYQRAPDVIGHVAARIELLDDKPPITRSADARMAPPNPAHAGETVLTGAG